MDSEDYTPYGANGFGQSWFGVTASYEGREYVVYDGTDGDRAEREAVSVHLRYHGKAYVSIMMNGETWKDVKHVPGELRTARVSDAGGCLHPQCGEINPLSCYCALTMDEETRERYRTYG